MVSVDTGSNGSVDVAFGYDALGRRVRQGNTVYVCAGHQVIAEYALGSSQASPTEQYVYGSYVDEPILKDGTVAGGAQ